MAGLLDQMRAAQTAQSRGLLSHTPQQRVSGRQVADAMQAMGLLASPIPVVGDVAGLLGDAAMYAAKPEERTAGNMALTALGVLPFFPALAGKLGKAGKLLDVTDKDIYKAVREAMGGKVTEAEVRQAVAQYNAALPKAAGGLGMDAANTAADRAKAQGFTVPAFRGSQVEEATHTKPVWWSEDRDYANAYAAHSVRPPKGQPDPYAGNVMPLLVRPGESKQFQKMSVGGVPDLHEFGGFNNGIETGFRRYPVAPQMGDMSGKVWEGLTVPQNVRSRFAAFDPAQGGAGNILASLAGVGLLSPLLLGDARE